MKKLYCGGRFHFDYLLDGYRENAAKDYRAVLLGNVDSLLKRSGGVQIHENTEYIGPFYFETDGMQDRDIVQVEWEMVRNCTDAIFLLESADCPGTVCELTAASMLGKRVHIFYLRDDRETESLLHTPCWYPLLHSISVNENTSLYECKDLDDAVERIVATVRKW
jgi:hypothetical protein